jgi:pimeloyl-ACP methyl ester carboxylesterase
MRKPAVVICHGFPGDTKNMDLAEELALNGFVTLVFYYQGAWGSGGNYSLTKLEVGAKDAVAWLRNQSYVDPERVGLVSHSMGALPLTKVMVGDPTVKTGVLISPATDYKEIIATRGVEGFADALMGNCSGKLAGVSKEKMMKDISKVAESTNPIDLIKKIKAPTMVIVGSKDDITPTESCRRLYEAANEPKKWVEVDGADHGFSEHRIPLICAVIDRLKVTV